MKIFIKFYENLTKNYQKIFKFLTKFEKNLTKNFKIVKNFVQNLYKICTKFVQNRSVKYHINNILTQKNRTVTARRPHGDRTATARRPHGDRTATEPYMYIYMYNNNNINIINIIPKGIILEFLSEIHFNHFLINLGELKWN